MARIQSIVAGVLALGLACVAGSRAVDDPRTLGPDTSEAEPQTGEAATGEVEQAAPVPTPLTPIDPAAAQPQPKPKPKSKPKSKSGSDEPLPFDDEQLERIYAVQDIVAAASAARGVDPALINGLIWVESKFERKARGPAGAQGLMQLMPKTAGAMAKRLERKRNSWDPDFNIHAGTLLLSRLLERFEGDERLALAGYNRGGGTVSKWLAANEPFPEGVETFVVRVLTAKAWFERLPPSPDPLK